MSKQQAGFSLIELLVVIALVGLIGSMFYNFFSVNLGSYLRLQADASEAAGIAAQSQRVASVVRGTTGIIDASANELTVYAYFYPSDTYVSKVRYYMSSDKKQLFSDVTPMTSNPPIGTPIPAQLKTYTIAREFYLPASGNLFNFLDASQDVLAFPITDLNAVKTIRINLATQDSSGAAQDTALQVALRNRKTNL